MKEQKGKEKRVDGKKPVISSLGHHLKYTNSKNSKSSLQKVLVTYRKRLAQI